MVLPYSTPDDLPTLIIAGHGGKSMLSEPAAYVGTLTAICIRRKKTMGS